MNKIEIYDADYLPTENDDDTMVAIKESISALRPVERKIFLKYTEAGTYTAVAREYNVSVPTVHKYIDEIRRKILDNANTDSKPDIN